jgi:phosphopantothenoylcysteine decarboxylase/phosphopantothenate--cysteine ligase
MTGSIACYKACHVISRLVQAGCEVQVVASPAALQFVGNATLEGLSGRPVVSDMYARGNVMDHIHLMRWPDLILVAPATASFINKAAQGVGDDLIQTMFLAHDFTRPFMIAPAMNKSMYTHPVTQKSLESLRGMGIEVLDSASGILACGEEGWGRLLEPDLILKFVFDALKLPKEAAKAAAMPATKKHLGKILVTAGGTIEPIDTVRAITNLSSGKTGVVIAESLSHMGFEVTLLQSHASTVKADVAHRDVFTTFKSLDEKVKKYLSEDDYTHVIHAAAVSDYSLESVEVNGQTLTPLEVKKISSDAPGIKLNLKRNHKIVDNLKSYSKNKDLKVIAFKLTSHASPEGRKAAVDKLFKNSNADFVVHNDLADIDPSKRTHRFTFYSKTDAKNADDLGQITAEIIHAIVPKDTL